MNASPSPTPPTLSSLKRTLEAAQKALSSATAAIAHLETHAEPQLETTASSATAPDAHVLALETVGDRLIPLVDWPTFHPWPRLGGLRHLVLHANENGFTKVIRKVGGRVLIDEKSFFEWAEAQAVRRASRRRLGLRHGQPRSDSLSKSENQ